MKEYSVSLNLIVPSAVNSPEVLSKRLGLPPSLFEQRHLESPAKEKMELRGETEWLLESRLERNLSLNEHIDDVKSMIPSDLILNSDNQIKSTYLNIGVFFDSRKNPIPVISFSAESIKFFYETFPNFEVEIAHYSCDIDEE